MLITLLLVIQLADLPPQGWFDRNVNTAVLLAVMATVQVLATLILGSRQRTLRNESSAEHQMTVTEVREREERLAAAVAAVAKEAARIVARDLLAENKKLTAMIAENTAISRDANVNALEASREANNVNKKLEALGIEHNALQRKEQEG